MHLISRYSFGCGGAKINKPRLLEKFFPVTVDKYITLQPASKYNSKCYSMWQDVVNELHPILKKYGISILQVGGKDDKKLKNCYNTSGQTNIGQLANIISKSILHVGVDSFATHIASGYGKKIVCLYSNNYAKNVSPYWTKPEDCILLEPNRKPGEKPSFSSEENPKSINTITPEKVAASVLKLLDIPYNETKETVFVGEHYGNQMIETVPNQIIDPNLFGVNMITVRMDFLFDESILIEQMKRCPVSIVTNKPISRQTLESFRGQIHDIVYEIDENHNVDFANILLDLHIPYHLITKLNDEKLAPIKLDYFDGPIIHLKNRVDRIKVKELKEKGATHYKSCKHVLGDGKIYGSKAHWKAEKPLDNPELNFQEIIDCDEFWQELDCFRLIKSLS